MEPDANTRESSVEFESTCELPDSGSHKRSSFSSYVCIFYST